jgi:transcriptional regulator with XRE-family HTH domain
MREPIQRLRIRPFMTLAALPSLPGIQRTYLSRAERGRVMPSIIALMRIAGSLRVDKILVRVRTSSSQL